MGDDNFSFFLFCVLLISCYAAPRRSGAMEFEVSLCRQLVILYCDSKRVCRTSSVLFLMKMNSIFSLPHPLMLPCARFDVVSHENSKFIKRKTSKQTNKHRRTRFQVNRIRRTGVHNCSYSASSTTI